MGVMDTVDATTTAGGTSAEAETRAGNVAQIGTPSAMATDIAAITTIEPEAIPLSGGRRTTLGRVATMMTMTKTKMAAITNRKTRLETRDTVPTLTLDAAVLHRQGAAPGPLATLSFWRGFPRTCRQTR